MLIRYVLIIRFSDVFTVGQWSELDNYSDDLSLLKKCLPELCMSARADSTNKKYRYAFNAFCKWSNLHNICPLPASKMSVSLYLAHITQSAKSGSKLNEVTFAISWAHRLAGLPDPCKSDLVNLVNEGAQRKIGHLVKKKEPITRDMLKQMVDTFKNGLKDIRITCMCLLCYSGFLRFSELVNLRRIDIQFCSSHVKLFLYKSKTDVYREGRDVIISRTFSETCPVNMLEKYLKLASIEDGSTEYIFRSLKYCKSTNMYALRKSGQLSYTRAREILLESLEILGLDRTKFGLHSLRSGGASAAAAAGVTDRLFKKHGRWKSDTAKDGYVKESLSERLSVSRNLGI